MKKTIAVMATTLLFACAEPVPFEESFRTALETAQPGDVIEIPAGTFSFDRSLIMNTDGVTIRGQGMDASILSFKGSLQALKGSQYLPVISPLRIWPSRTRSAMP